MPQLSIVGYTPLPDDTKKPSGPIIVRSREEVLGQLDRGLNAPPAQPASTGLTIAGYEPPRATDEERRTVLGFLGNTVGSTGRLLGGLVNVPEQVKGITALFAGMAEKSGFKALPGQPDGNAVDSLIAHYKDRYGSFEGFKKAMYEDPAGVMFDIATVLEPAAGGLKLAGLPRAAAVTTRVARNINPVALTLRGGAAALPHVAPVVRAAPTAIEGGAKGAYKAAVAPRTAGEAALGYIVGQVAGPQAGAAVSTTLTGARVARGAYRGAREALKARAAAAAEALATETAAAADVGAVGPVPVERQLPPGATRMPAAADASYVRHVPGEYAAPDPLPPSRQLAAPGPSAIVTPAPDLPPDASYVRAVRAPLPEVIPPTLRINEAALDAARQMREAMGLGPEEFRPPAADAPDFAAITRGGQLDRMARKLQEAGIDAQDAAKLDPPDLAAVAKAAGIEGPLGIVSRDVVARLQELEKPVKKAPVRKTPARAVEPAPTPAAPAPTPESAALGEMLPEYRTPVGEAAAAAPTASARRVKAVSKWLAEGEIGTELVARLETDAGARKLLDEQSRRLGHRSIGPGEIPQIIEEVQRLRSEGVKPAPKAKRKVIR